MKAKKYWTESRFMRGDNVWLSTSKNVVDDTPVLIVPLDPASVERIREKVARLIRGNISCGEAPTDMVLSLSTADAILAALGITTPSPRRKKQ